MPAAVAFFEVFFLHWYMLLSFCMSFCENPSLWPMSDRLCNTNVLSLDSPFRRQAIIYLSTDCWLSVGWKSHRRVMHYTAIIVANAKSRRRTLLRFYKVWLVATHDVWIEYINVLITFLSVLFVHKSSCMHKFVQHFECRVSGIIFSFLSTEIECEIKIFSLNSPVPTFVVQAGDCKFTVCAPPTRPILDQQPDCAFCILINNL